MPPPIRKAERKMIIKDRRKEEQVEYNRQFTYVGEYFGNGFSFPCDENGNLCDDLTDAAKENFKWCMSHPEKVTDDGVVKRRYYVTIPALNRCRCGFTFDLMDEYMGACECPGCGQWYNLFGQELNDPSMWEE